MSFDEYVVAYAEFELFEGIHGVGLKWAFPDTEYPAELLDACDDSDWL